jgi:predicted  nucleic acid-binding Zn-ribbon protein
VSAQGILDQLDDLHERIEALTEQKTELQREITHLRLRISDLEQASPSHMIRRGGYT